MIEEILNSFKYRSRHKNTFFTTLSSMYDLGLYYSCLNIKKQNLSRASEDIEQRKLWTDVWMDR